MGGPARSLESRAEVSTIRDASGTIRARVRDVWICRNFELYPETSNKSARLGFVFSLRPVYNLR